MGGIDQDAEGGPRSDAFSIQHESGIDPLAMQLMKLLE